MKQADFLAPRIECEFSDCRRYRYTWKLIWDRELPPVAFIGLNPSTADELRPDPTVRRCIGYAKAWGYGGLIMLNLFAFRATDPRDMKAQDDPVGPANDEMLINVVMFDVQDNGGIVVAAWGAHGTWKNRAAGVRAMFEEDGILHYLKLTKDGHPGHPLYLKGDLKPTRWE